MVSNIIQERLDRRTFYEDTDTLGLSGLAPWQYRSTPDSIITAAMRQAPSIKEMSFSNHIPSNPYK